MNIKLISALAAGVLFAAPALSQAFTLDFEGASSFQSIDGYYNNGTDGNGLTGAYYGTAFGLDALAVTNDELGPYFSNPPSGSSVMTAVGDSAAMNVFDGFIDQISFSYSSTEATSVSLFDGLNGTGTLLGTINLAANAQSGGCSDAPLCFWDVTTFEFDGVAKSIQFGTAKYVAAFDDVNVVSAVPLPAAGWLLISALGGLGVFSRRKRAA